MTIKKRAHSSVDGNAIENLAKELADRPYGKKYDTIVRTTVSLPESVLYKLEDMAINNKRKNSNLRSVSAIVRHCIEKCLNI